MNIQSNRTRRVVEQLLEGTGIQIGGDAPWDIAIQDNRFYRRVLAQGTLGLGESYMDGWWDCPHLDQFFYRLLSADVEPPYSLSVFWESIRARLFNLQKLSRAFQIGERHYDRGNDLFQAMLDSGMNYSCGYWRTSDNLEDAQRAKLDLICRKLNLKSGQYLLDIGCGWGGLVKYAAEHYGVRCLGTTVSRRQAELAYKRCEGLPIEIELLDYRKLEGVFDHIASVGMVEHVGLKNYRRFMKCAHSCLADDGLFLLHTIGSRLSGYSNDPWIDKYIFPNGMLPSIAQLARVAEGLFIIEDIHNFGADYDKTLMAWHANFEQHWDLLNERYDERFRRMWRYYLLACAGAFRARKLQLWQIVYSKRGVPGGYIAPR